MLLNITQRIFDLQEATRILTEAIIQWLRDAGEMRSLVTKIAVDKLDEICVQNSAETTALQKQLADLATQTESGSANGQLLRYWAEGCRTVAEQLLNNARLFEQLAHKHER